MGHLAATQRHQEGGCPGGIWVGGAPVHLCVHACTYVHADVCCLVSVHRYEKIKLRHIKHFKSLLVQNQFESGSAKLEVLHRQELGARLTDRRGRSQARKEFDWLQLERLPYLGASSWLIVIGCS